MQKCIKYTKLDFAGYNFSFTPYKNGYIGTIRQFIYSPNSPCKNLTYILEMDKNFNVLSNHLLNENTYLLPRFLNWTTGIEDSKLIDESSLICVSVDTNPHWKTEVAYVEFSYEEKEIKKIVRFYVEGEEGRIKNEKNWLLMKKKNDEMHLLYSYNPIQIISVDLNTGKGNIIKSYNKNNLSFNCHGGYCIFINKINKYLVTVRNYNRNERGDDKYISNSWLLFDEEYELCGISKTFIFEMKEDYKPEDPPYQMCMKLHIENDILYAAVSIQDSYINIYEFNINDILNNIESII